MRKTITPWRRHIDVVCAQLYKHYVAFIKVCQSTKLGQRHGDTSITVIFFTVVKNIDEHWNISLFRPKA